MKTKTLLAIAFSLVLVTSCTNSDRCVTFTPENVESIKDRIDKDLFTQEEKLLIAQYFMNYTIMHPKKEMENNPFTKSMQEKVMKEGFKECSNLCEVLEFQSEKKKK